MGMIPEAAVEAVVNTFGRADNPRWDDPLAGYATFSDAQKALLRETARAALEAAAPYMLAGAWNEGHGAGQLDPYCLNGNPYDPRDRPAP